MKVVFFGTPDFSVPALEALYNHPSIELIGVVTMPDRKAGRGQELQSPPVAQFAKDNKISLIQTENINKEDGYLSELQTKGVDFIIVLAFAQFLGSKLLALPKLGCFNIHTSLLPKYRGAAPIQYALLNGDTTTGVSIQRMVKKMDAGDLVHSHEQPIYPYENGGMLYTRLKFQAALSLIEFINELKQNRVTYTTQDESKVSFAPTLTKEDGHLKFKDENSTKILNKIRALDPWPGTFCFLNGKRLKVLSAEVVTPYGKKPSAGELQTSNNHLEVGVLDGVLRLTKVQLEGKNSCSDLELLNGLRNQIKDAPLLIT